MSLSLYDLTVPMFTSALTNLSHILKKAEQHADASGIPHSDLLTARLAPDMLPLTFQIQTASNSAKHTLVRVAGATAVPMDDNESSFEELQARIARTLEVLKGIKRAEWEGTEGKEVVFKLGGEERRFDGLGYVQSFALPNVWFHVATAYGILRAKGVPLGKADFLKGGS